LLTISCIQLCYKLAKQPASQVDNINECKTVSFLKNDDIVDAGETATFFNLLSGGPLVIAKFYTQLLLIE